MKEFWNRSVFGKDMYGRQILVRHSLQNDVPHVYVDGGWRRSPTNAEPVYERPSDQTLRVKSRLECQADRITASPRRVIPSVRRALASTFTRPHTPRPLPRVFLCTWYVATTHHLYHQPLTSLYVFQYCPVWLRLRRDAFTCVWWQLTIWSHMAGDAP